MNGAVGLAKLLGVSSLIIGLTVVAMGTSAPEVAASIAGVLRKAGGGDIAVGNLVGSNIFNTLLVTGAAGVVRSFDVTHRLAGGVDYWIMVIVSAAFAGAVIIGKRTIGRVSGTLLVCAYFGYIIYLLSA